MRRRMAWALDAMRYQEELDARKRADILMQNDELNHQHDLNQAGITWPDQYGRLKSPFQFLVSEAVPLPGEAVSPDSAPEVPSPSHGAPAASAILKRRGRPPKAR
jgi:hypothetical protein